MLSLKVPTEDNFRTSPKSVCSLYLMLKLHFEGKRDAVKYNWTFGISDASFNKRRDKSFFEKIAYKYKIHELTYLFVSSLLSKTNDWIGGMTSEASVAQYRKYDSILKMYKREFTREMEIISLYCNRYEVDFKEVVAYNKKRDTSRLIDMLKKGIVKYETFIILDRFLNLIDNYDKVSDSYEWMELSKILKAYRKLLVIDDIDATVTLFINEMKRNFNININEEKILKIVNRKIN